jgi:hypothetical protein
MVAVAYILCAHVPGAGGIRPVVHFIALDFRTGLPSTFLDVQNILPAELMGICQLVPDTSPCGKFKPVGVSIILILIAVVLPARST